MPSSSRSALSFRAWEHCSHGNPQVTAGQKSLLPPLGSSESGPGWLSPCRTEEERNKTSCNRGAFTSYSSRRLFFSIIFFKARTSCFFFFPSEASGADEPGNKSCCTRQRGQRLRSLNIWFAAPGSLLWLPAARPEHRGVLKALQPPVPGRAGSTARPQQPPTPPTPSCPSSGSPGGAPDQQRELFVSPSFSSIPAGASSAPSC